MIEKIDHADIVPREVLVAKLNELIDEVDFLSKAMERILSEKTLNEVRREVDIG